MNPSPPSPPSREMNQDEFGLLVRPELDRRGRIERAWNLFHSVIPASSADFGRRRTPYFYRREAIAWARHHRQRLFGIFGDSDTCLRLAKSYLASYREMKSAL